MKHPRIFDTRAEGVSKRGVSMTDNHGCGSRDLNTDL